jgi:enhancing lycopene biosynthesis protein 2
MGKKKIGVILSGCGVYDGAEISESVITLLAIDRRDAEAVCLAPNMDQMHVVDHLTGDATGETRNVLRESARIARGQITDVSEASIEQFDAIVIPGGFGAAKNLSNFAVEGESADVHPEVGRLVRECVDAGKPLGAACIAPALVAAAFKGQSRSVTLTIGNDVSTAKAIETMGAKHRDCPVRDIIVDEQNKIVSTPAYMIGQRVSEVADGIEKMVDEILKMA